MNTDPAINAPPPARPPNIRQVVTRLVGQLSTIKPNDRTQDAGVNLSTSGHQDDHDNGSSSSRNRFSRLCPADLARAKSVMLTLHCMFPNELLLALDILDRRLVTQLLVIGTSHGRKKTDGGGGSGEGRLHGIYLVRSMSAWSTRGAGGPGPRKSYEVRLGSWNCTCPAFTLAAFRDLESTLSLAGLTEDEEEDKEEEEEEEEEGEDDERSWFGGTLTSGSSKISPPMCKHLLACVLAGKCPALFGQGVGETRETTASEMAGWCAGYAG